MNVSPCLLGGASGQEGVAFGPGSHASHEAPSGSSPSVSIPNAVDLDRAYEIVGEMLEYFDSHRLATWAPLAAIIMREVKGERDACVMLALQWARQNKEQAAKARSREQRMNAFGFDHPGMAEMLDGAAIECNAIASAMSARSAETGTGSVRQDASAAPEGGDAHV